MIPTAATIARQRHLARIALRSMVLVLGAWSLVGTASTLATILLAGSLNQFLASGSGESLSALFVQPSTWMLALATAAWLMEKRLVAWLVPVPRHRCPGCDYSLAAVLESRCPECGLPLGELVESGFTPEPKAPVQPSAPGPMRR